MTANGVPRLHVEKVLNHTIDDVAEIYDRHDYAKEKRAALEGLAKSIQMILRARPAQQAQRIKSRASCSVRRGGALRHSNRYQAVPSQRAIGMGNFLGNSKSPTPPRL